MQAIATSDPRRQFLEEGYVVVKDLIPDRRIAAVLQALERFKHSGYPYYSQSIHTWIMPQIDAAGFMQESMEDFTRLYLNGGLARSGNEILLGQEVHEILRLIHPDREHFCLWQNMLFDRSTGTVDHFDSWYLDTVPKGQLIGAWVALEDIDEDCGPFHVYPRSHLNVDASAMANLSHPEFVARCAEMARALVPKPALLERGSVLFWHPSTLHGASHQRVANRSRKSLTAHYFPMGVARQRSGARVAKDAASCRAAIARDLAQTRVFEGLPIALSYGMRSQLKFNASGMLRFALDRLRGRPSVSMDMRRR